MQKYVGRIEKRLEQETDARIKRILAPVVRGLLAQEKRLARIEQQLDELIAQLTRSIDVEHDFDGARSQVRRLMFVEKLLKEIHRAGSTAAAL